MLIERLNWDSDFFGYEVGKMECHNKINKIDFLRAASDSNFEVVYLFSDYELPELGLDLVDRKVTFHRNLAKIETFYDHLNAIYSYSYSDDSFEQLCGLALDSGVYSRFNVDNNFKNHEYEKLYYEWIKQSVLGGKAFDSIVYFEQEKLLAFATLERKSTHLADIGLVAVHKNARGKGIGNSIIMKCLKKARNAGFSEIQVVTQQENIPAMRLYEKCGFKIQKVKFIYHYWNI